MIHTLESSKPACERIAAELLEMRVRVSDMIEDDALTEADKDRLYSAFGFISLAASAVHRLASKDASQ